MSAANGMPLTKQDVLQRLKEAESKLKSDAEEVFVCPHGGVYDTHAQEAASANLRAQWEAKRGAGQWKDPAQVKTRLLPVEPLTGEMIPAPLRGWLTDIANRMRCPIDYVASACVVMLSSMVGTRLAIKPKQYDDWTIVPNLWGAAIGDPSMLKTPSVAEVFRPLNRIIAEAREEFERELTAYLAAQSVHEVQKKVFQSQEADRMKGRKVDNPVSYPSAPRKPTEKRRMVNDTTIEKLGALLNENPAGLLMFRDELVGLLASWDKMGREEDRAFYLEAWNGSGSKTIDRVGSGTLHVASVCVSLFGGIQPAKLMGYLQAATGYENDGFVQRLQVAVFPDKPQWEYIDRYPDKDARDTAFAIIKNIAESDFSKVGYQADEYNKFDFTRFDEPAQEVFRQWLTRWQTEVLPGESGLLLEHFAKYPSLMPSLSLVFHLVNHAHGSALPDGGTGKHLVSVEAAQMAVKWCGYLQSHARRIYGLLDSAHVSAAKELLKHLRMGDLSGGFKARDVQRKGWTLLKDIGQVEAALSELVRLGWLRLVEPDTKPNGRPETPGYLIHPKLSQNG